MKRIELTQRASSDLRTLDRQIARRIYAALRKYASAGSGDVKKLQGSITLFRLRVGDWRVIFTLEDPDVLTVARVAHRSEIYR